MRTRLPVVRQTGGDSMGAHMRTGERTRGARAHRMMFPAFLLSVLVGCSVGFVMSDKASKRDSAQVLLAANRLERLVVDMETGQLGYVATGDEGTLSPWLAARSAFPVQAAALLRLAAANSPDQARRAQEIVRLATSYLHDHAEPLLRTARRDRSTARSLLTRAEGRRRLTAIRHKFDHFADVQHRLALTDERDAVPAMRRMIAAAAGASGSLLLIFLLLGFVRRGRASGQHTLVSRFGTARLIRSGRPGRPVRIPGESEALQGLATLVARDASPAEVIDAAAGEIGRILLAEHVMINRYEPDGTMTVAGHWSAPDTPRIMPPATGSWPVEDETVADIVYRTGRPARLRKDLSAVGGIGAWLRTHDIEQLIGCPIVAGDHLWGMAAVLSRAAKPWPPATEETMREFTALVGVAIANARRRSELAASRVRLIEAADATRHRIERVLHENTQQRLVSVGLSLRAAEATVPPEMDELRQQVSCAAHDVTEIIEGLQNVARELHPAFLAKGGLESALRALARRAALPVEVEVHGDRRLPPNAAMTAYYVVSEALTNAAAHARATIVRVHVDLGEPVRLSARDDGIGGARPHPGSALAALKDRIEALGGVLEIESPPGKGTSLYLTIPTSPDHPGVPPLQP
ncbi:MAG: putative two-component histidine kinase [Actinoallomurus sp.]|nr:putative two-component histidine kinase [Actinoallomurus sp.]